MQCGQVIRRELNLVHFKPLIPARLIPKHAPSQ
jgi:hypothetical protein